MFAYDVVAYPSRPLPQAHPDRIATNAALLGVNTAPPDQCRYLEIGAGDGIHLISSAAALPESHFIGIDLSLEAVKRGQQMIDELGLSNVQLHQADLMEWSTSDSFDIIMAHGFYSWVPAFVRDRMFEIIRDHLAPQGVAYVSYNTLPGGHIRRMLREMMRFHVRDHSEAVEQVQQSIALLQFLSQARKKEGDPYSELLHHEAEQCRSDKAPAVLYHDDLAEINDPVYVRDFMAHARGYGLQFLTEADFHETQSTIYPKEIAAHLKAMADVDVVLKEQYIDFLKCRRFRQTLLCRQDVRIDKVPSPSRLRSMAFSTSARPVSERPDLAPGVVESFTAPRGGSVKIDLPIAKAALITLCQSGQHRLRFSDLVAESCRLVGMESLSEEETVTLTELLLAIHSAGVISLHSLVPNYARIPGEKPELWAPSRLQLRYGHNDLVNILGGIVRIEDQGARNLLQLLDGTRDREQLVEELAQKLKAEGSINGDEQRFRQTLKDAVERSLETAANRALLVK